MVLVLIWLCLVSKFLGKKDMYFYDNRQDNDDNDNVDLIHVKYNNNNIER